jgi:hypothetical protein
MPEPTVKVRMKENARAVPGEKPGGAHVIALGDVSVAEKEIAVTSAVHSSGPIGIAASPARLSWISCRRTPEQASAVFDVPGGSALRHDTGGQLAAGLNAPSV